jgi:tetratricopeptide (TPR) repeat protein
MNRNAVTFMAAAKEKEKEGKLIDAATLLKQYISLKPEDYDSYVEMARILASVGDNPNVSRDDASMAYTMLDQYVIKLPQDTPQHAAFRRHCVEFGSRFGVANMVISHAGYLLSEAPENLTDEQLVEVNMRLARALASDAEKDYEAARRRFSQLVGFDYGGWGSQEFKLDPAEVDIDRYKQDVSTDDQRGEAKWNKALERWWGKGTHELDAYSALSTLARMGEPSKAKRDLSDRFMDRMVEMNGDSFEAYLRRGQYFFNNSRGLEELRTKAREDIAKAQQLQPEDATVILAVADLAIRDQKWQEAESMLDRAIEKYPGDARMYQVRSDVALRQGQRDVAMKTLEQGLVAVPSSADLLLLKVDLQLQENQLDEVRATLETMQRVGVRKELLDYIDARILFIEKDWVEAAKRFEEVLPKASSLGRSEFRSQIDLLLGQCYEQMAKWDLAYDAYDRARIANPGLTAAQSGIARMEVRSGRKRPSDMTEPAAGGSPQTGVQEQVQQIKQRQPQLTELQQQLLTVDLYMQRREYDEARKILQELSKTHGDDMEFWRAAVRFGLRDPKQSIDTARAAFDTARKRFEGQQFPMTLERFWLEAIDVASRREDQGTDEALRLVDRAVQEVGDTAILRQAKARLLARQGGDGLRDKLVALEEGVESAPQNEQLAFWLSMTTIYYQSGMPDDARRCLERFDDLSPDSLPVKLTLFGMALEAKDDAMIERTLEAIRKMNDPTTTAYCEAAHTAHRARTGSLSGDARATAINDALAKID